MNDKALIEALLFVSTKPLSIKTICKISGLKEDDVRKLIKELMLEYEKDEHGIMIIESPEGYEIVLKPEYRTKAKYVAPFSDLSEGMKRTLAIVAIKQPIKQSVIVRYQGNKAYDYIKALEKKGLIKTEKFGRTKIVSLTENFERYFGKSVEEIKKELEKTISL